MNGLFGDSGGLNTGQTQSAAAPAQSPFAAAMGNDASTWQSTWNKPTALPDYFNSTQGSDILGGAANPQRDAIAHTLTQQAPANRLNNIISGISGLTGQNFTPPTAAAPASFTPQTAAPASFTPQPMAEPTPQATPSSYAPAPDPITNTSFGQSLDAYKQSGSNLNNIIGGIAGLSGQGPHTTVPQSADAIAAINAQNNDAYMRSVGALSR